ncbi:DUF6538 domain-containing protein [Agrobacterium bohemicum]|uniref:DUF6538 domain-containing protein n=1 Tax=Agrobacterium bohemicum TaxID=2052828 RepID=UPI000AF4257F
MEKNCSLMQRGKVYYLRICVPRIHQSRLGREIWKSLKTSNRDVAHVLSGKYISEYHANIEAIGLGGDDLTYLKAQESAKAIGVDYLPAEKLKQQNASELLTTLIRSLSSLESVKNPDEAHVAVVGGAIPEQLSLDDMLTRYKKLAGAKWLDLDERARDKKWNRYANPVQDFKDTMGDMDVLDIKPKHAFDYAIKLGERIKRGEIKSETAKKKLLFLSAMVRKVFQSNFPDRANPFEHASIDYEGDKETRKPFTETEIAAVTERLQNCDANDELIAILQIAQNTGAHAKEIVLASANDIVLDAPIPFIRIGVNENRKKLKTGGARHRDIPLVGVALEAAKRHPNGFPRYCRSGGSEALSSAANKIIKSVAPGKTTYSFRHRLFDLLRDADGIEDSLLKAIVGHNGGMTAGYGTGFTLEKKAAALLKALPA